MGCTSSREGLKDLPENLRPLHRSSSFSLPFGHSISGRRHRSRFASSSSTPVSDKLGSVHEDATHSNDNYPASEGDGSMEKVNGCNNVDPVFSSDVRMAQRWSEMIEMRMPKSPPEGAEGGGDLWEELLENAGSYDPLRHFPGVERSSSHNGAMQEKKGGEDGEQRKQQEKKGGEDGEQRKQQEKKGGEDGEQRKQQEKKGGEQTMWQEKEGRGSRVRRRLASMAGLLPPLSPSPTVVKEKTEAGDGEEGRAKGVRERMVSLKERILRRRAAWARAAAEAAAQAYSGPPGGQRKVILYLTSLRGIRKTYEDCCETLTILKGYAIRIDERDVSMHSGFKEELAGILGPAFSGSQLPRIFANGHYLGGAEEIRMLHENGKLSKALKGCQPIPKGVPGTDQSCEACGDMRFMPCDTCNGSCKVYVQSTDDEKEEEEEEEKEEEDEGEDHDGETDREESGGFQRCQDCNENGLVRCPVCCKE